MPRHDSGGIELGSRLTRWVGLVTACVGSWAIVMYLMTTYADSLRSHQPLVWRTILFAMSFAITSLLSAVLRSPAVTVGAEGLRIRVGIRHYFIPYNCLAGVRFESSRLVLEYIDRRTVSLRAAAPRAQCDALVVLIDKACQGYANRELAPDFAALNRSGRPLVAWRQALGSLVGASTYRVEVIEHRTLVRILADVGLPAERRIAAAIALAHGGDATEQIRAAASACASKPMQVALERAADETIDDATIEQAISYERTPRLL